jgi:hypothetical protein
MGSVDAVIDRFVPSSTEFERKLLEVRPEQWAWPTPCAEWNVRRWRTCSHVEVDSDPRRRSPATPDL